MVVADATGELEIQVDAKRQRVLFKNDSFSFSQIRHVFVNKDSNNADMIAGAVVIQTMPGDASPPTSLVSPQAYEHVLEGKSEEEVRRQVEFLDSLGKRLREELRNVPVTDTNLPQELFHRAFAEIG